VPPDLVPVRRGLIRYYPCPDKEVKEVPCENAVNSRYLIN
jgi:hypothetical protein